MSTAPIGIFDSGVGGLSVLLEAVKLLPQENFIYFGDNKNAPYGVRPAEEIMELSFAAARFVQQHGAKAIVVACNTATSVAVEKMRECFSVPVISMEPAVKPAVHALRDGVALVMATPATIRQERYQRLLENVEHGEHHVINLPCPGFPEIVERGEVDSPELHSFLLRLFEQHREQRVEAIVLGCTHYIFAKKAIERAASELWKDVQFFDGNRGTVMHLKRTLEAKDLLNRSDEKGTVQLFSSGDDLRIFLDRLQITL